MAQDHQDKVGALTQAHSSEVEALAAEHQREWKEAKDRAVRVAETRVKALRRAFKEQVGGWCLVTLPAYRLGWKRIRAKAASARKWWQPASSPGGLEIFVQLRQQLPYFKPGRILTFMVPVSVLTSRRALRPCCYQRDPCPLCPRPLICYCNSPSLPATARAWPTALSTIGA